MVCVTGSISVTAGQFFVKIPQSPTIEAIRPGMCGQGHTELTNTSSTLYKTGLARNVS